jgi:REP element-mobilizing transposase RayT
MSNYRRAYQEGGYYFFTVVTYDRQMIVVDSLPLIHPTALGTLLVSAPSQDLLLEENRNECP